MSSLTGKVALVTGASHGIGRAIALDLARHGATVALDEAVFTAYGWPDILTDTEILERLLALNHERTAASPDRKKYPPTR